MAFTNFIPDIWAKAIERERDRYCVGVMNCRRDYEGELEFGKSIRTNWTKRPTVKDYTPGTDIDTAETLDGTTSVINIDQAKYINFMVDDVNELQANSKIMSSCMEEAAAAVAENADDFVFGLHSSATYSVTDADCDETTIIDTVGKGLTAIYQNDVPMTEEIALEVTPSVYQILWKAKVLNDTNNSSDLGNGYVGKFNGTKVYMSNGVVISGGVHKCFLRTKKAIGFVSQMKKMEAYRPQSLFSDAVKGLHIYGGGIIRPKELILLNITPSSEFVPSV